MQCPNHLIPLFKYSYLGIERAQEPSRTEMIADGVSRQCCFILRTMRGEDMYYLQRQVDR
jgi:hypothetical protein